MHDWKSRESETSHTLPTGWKGLGCEAGAVLDDRTVTLADVADALLQDVDDEEQDGRADDGHEQGLGAEFPVTDGGGAAEQRADHADDHIEEEGVVLVRASDAGRA